MKKTKILAGLLLASSLHACSWFGDPSPSLPPETQEGKNTFACLVNGKLWVAEFGSKDIFNTQKTEAQYSAYRQGSLGIRATRGQEYMQLGILETPKLQQYIFLRSYNFEVGDFDISYSVYDKQTTKCDYGGRNLSYFKGNTQIKKFDLTRRIVAGTFEAVLKTQGCDTIRITQGRFDMTF